MSEEPDSPAEWQIDLAAAAWLVKRDRGLTPAEQDEYLQWLTADPRHALWIARHERTWTDFDHLVQWRPEHSPEPNPDVLAPSPAPRARWHVPAFLAVAASLALGLAVWRPWQPPPSALATETHDRSTLVADAYERRTLSDGSVVELNRDTLLELDFSASERRVTLARGEAHFTVAKNPQRPFVVVANSVGVRAVGTAFNVRRSASAIDVLVTEGRVRLERPKAAPQSAPEPQELGVRERAVVAFDADAAPQISRVSEQEKAQLLAWQPELLEFDSAPLERVVAEFNRHNRVRLTLADPELAQMPIVASFRSDNLDGFVRLLTLTAGVQVERRSADEIVLRRSDRRSP